MGETKVIFKELSSLLSEHVRYAVLKKLGNARVVKPIHRRRNQIINFLNVLGELISFISENLSRILREAENPAFFATERGSHVAEIIRLEFNIRLQLYSERIISRNCWAFKTYLSNA